MRQSMNLGWNGNQRHFAGESGEIAPATIG
jgi:hypothetical protein